MNRTAALLLGIVCVFFPPVAKSQEPVSNEFPRYCLVQVVDSNTFLEKINEAAAQGYRLVAATQAPSQGFSAILEKSESIAERHSYLLIPLLSSQRAHTGPGRVRTEVAEHLNTAAAKGFHLAMTLGSGQTDMPGMALMESNPASQRLYEYALVAPNGFGSYKNSEILRLTASGYRWIAGGSILFGGSLLFFEKPSEPSGGSGSPAPQTRAASLKRIDFSQNNVVLSSLPEKQLHKSAVGGARLTDFFAYPPQTVLAMKETSTPQVPYEYVVLKPKKMASPSAGRARMQMVEASDLTALGQQGFRMLRLSVPVPPFVMEKAPGDSRLYEYQFASSPKVSELAEKLNSSGLAAFHVAKMENTDDGLVVVMEKTDPSDLARPL